jgi:hypothetical protein
MASTPLLPLPLVSQQHSRDQQAKLSLAARVCLYTLVSVPVALFIYDFITDELEHDSTYYFFHK